MNNAEFQIWWDHATVVIPSLADWAAKIRKHPEKNFDKIIGFWSITLNRVDLTAAKDAIEKLAQNDMPKYNRDFDSIPFRVKSMLSETLTMSPSSRFIGGSETVKCLECKDEGFLSVWHHVSVVAMRKGEFDPKRHQRTSAVRCTCEAGHLKSKNITMSNPSQHCVAEDTRDEGVEALRSFCNPHSRAKTLAGFDKGLAGFNEATPGNEDF